MKLRIQAFFVAMLAMISPIGAMSLRFENNMQQWGEAFAHSVRDIDADARRWRESKSRDVSALRQEIDRLVAGGAPANDPRIRQREDQISQLNREVDRTDKVGDVAVGMLQGAWNTVLADAQRDMNVERDRNRAFAEGLVANRGSMERARFYIEQLRDPRMILKVILLVAGATLGAAGVYYTIKILYQYIQANMGKPTLVHDSSRHGLAQTLRNFFNQTFMGQKPFDAKLSDIVLSPEVDLKATLLAEDTKRTREYGLPYQNVLFYGPPGTGKTEFAKILAHYSDMDYAILSGADFAQFKGGEAIAELHKLFDWAKNSPTGLIIFIDEADACFRDRATLDKDGVNFVNAFLSQTGAGSEKFMIILSTNYEDELDAAVRSRIHKKVPFFLPSFDDRVKIIMKKMEKYILNDSRQFERNGQHVTVRLQREEGINDAYIKTVAKKIEGFSGRDIDQMISEVRLRAYRTDEAKITIDIFDAVIKDKIAEIEKDKKATAYQRERFEQALHHFGGEPAAVTV